MIFFLIFSLFVGVPLVEITLFILVGGEIGIVATIAIVVLTAMLGTVLIRIQGFGILRRFQGSVQEGRLPLQEVFDGMCLLVAGAFLLTPGFFTDGMGFLLLFQPFRDLLLAWLGPRIVAHAWPGQKAGSSDDGVIDGEYTIVEDHQKPTRAGRSRDDGTGRDQ